MSLRSDFLASKLEECFLYALESEIDTEVYDEYNFPPMIFLVDEDWEIVGGTMADIEDIGTMVFIAKNLLIEEHLSDKKLLPYVMAITCGQAQNESDLDDIVRGRLYNIYSDEFSYSKIDFSDNRKSFVTNEIIEDSVKEHLSDLLEHIKTLDS